MSIAHKRFDVAKSSPQKRSETLKAHYFSLVELIVLGKYEETAIGLSELREFDSDSDQAEALRRLVAVRLSIKRGQPGNNFSWLDMDMKKDSWIAGEKYLVLGHWRYYLQQFSEGMKCFEKAEAIFKKLEMRGREFVSHFNQIVGAVSGPLNMQGIEQLDKLRALELKILPFINSQDCARVQAMVHRQKAHAFEDLNRLNASLEEISKAIAIFELNGPESDFHLAVLHAADICLDLKEDFKAKTFFEYIIPPVDSRVEFPLAFVSWRFGGVEPVKKNFAIVPSGWKEKFEHLLSESKVKNNDVNLMWTWNQDTGALSAPHFTKAIILKPASLEGRLIKFLIQEKASKGLLIETLWPDQSDIHLLDNRLHRMISRLNKKLHNIIIFDGKNYSLKNEIVPDSR